MPSKAAWKTTLGSNTTTAIETLGVLREEEDADGSKAYRYIKAIDAVAAGDIQYAVTPQWNTTGATTTIPNIANRRVVGVGIGTITAGNYGWIQVRGYNSNITVSSQSLVAGSPLIPSATKGVATVYTVSGSPTQTEIQNAGLVFGTVMLASSSSTVGNGNINCF